MDDIKRELEHTEKIVEPGDAIRLQFPNEEFVDVVVVVKTDDQLIISEDGVLLEFQRVVVPFDLKGTSLGDVCGELKMWKSVEYPDSAPAMIVANLGKPT